MGSSVSLSVVLLTRCPFNHYVCVAKERQSLENRMHALFFNGKKMLVNEFMQRQQGCFKARAYMMIILLAVTPTARATPLPLRWVSPFFLYQVTKSAKQARTKVFANVFRTTVSEATKKLAQQLIQY
eukprot:TRINITY_DN3580_c0_g1_i3.p2 TRINITY_DN3580_c0_g1~~TRINITY_DN3580_c0_g1_i3.p2  ORF type:complete len:127 (+),score=5.57 TRINITY_DN3580_c0_g1_i3:1713-2093(+)